VKWSWSTPKEQLVEMIEVQRIEILNLQGKIKHYETLLEQLSTSYETLQRQLVEQRERLQQRERQLTEQMGAVARARASTRAGVREIEAATALLERADRALQERAREAGRARVRERGEPVR